MTIMERIKSVTYATTDRRTAYQAIWDDIPEGQEKYARCVLAHYMADLQEDPRDELMWDLRALEAAQDLPSFLPSLHLNIANVYERLGETENARKHIRQAQGVAGNLSEVGYGRMIRAGIERMALRLS